MRDLKAALSKNYVSAGSNLTVAASRSGKRRRDQLTPKSGCGSDDWVFCKGSSFTCTNRVEKVPRENAGALFREGLVEISKFLRSPEESFTSEDSARMLAYLNSTSHGRHLVKDVGIETAQEMRTLALAMGALTSGHLPLVADPLMQGLKGLELAVDQKDWTPAGHLGHPTDRQAWRRKRRRRNKRFFSKN